VNVVHYTHAAGSGAGRYVANLTTSLVASGVGVELICPSDFADVDRVRASGVGVRLSARSLVGASGRSAKLARAIGQSLAGARLAIRPRPPRTIVHLDFVGIPLLAIPVAAAWRLRGATVVLTVHDVEPHRSLLGGRFAGIERLAQRVLYRLASHLIVHFETGRTQLRRVYGISGNSITVIPHGAEIANKAARRARRPQAGELVRVAVLGGIRRNKGTHLAIEAVQQLRRSGLPVELTIAGQPPVSEAAYWRQCLDLIEADPAAFRVIARFLSDEEMQAELERTDAVLLPYDGFSAQSGVAIDALSHGRAVIATAQGGLGDLLATSGAGIRIRDASVPAVADAVAEAVAIGASGLAILGAAGAAHARTSLSWSTIGASHRRLYEALAAGPQ
jgi:glycosyltransferase involved in cell wall biosynthesis